MKQTNREEDGIIKRTFDFTHEFHVVAQFSKMQCLSLTSRHYGPAPLYHFLGYKQDRSRIKTELLMTRLVVCLETLMVLVTNRSEDRRAP